MTFKIIEILKELNASEELLNYIKGNYKKPPYNEGVVFSEALEINENKTLTDKDRLFLTLKELVGLESDYIELDIDIKVFKDTLNDLMYRINRTFDNHGYYGLSKHDMKWLGYIFRLETFQIHNLKFRKYPLTYLEIERSGEDYLSLSDEVKEVFYEGLPVIYVHIAKGTDLSDESVQKSFEMAYRFFEKHFGEYKYEYFICRTWMLYPGLDNILSESSNILKFKNRFTIIGSHINSSQSLLRVYGSDDIEVIKSMSKETSLEKIMYHKIDDLGVSVGYIKKEEFNV